MKKQTKRVIVMMITSCFLLVVIGKPARADTFNGQSTGGVNLRIKDKGTTEPTDSSSIDSSSSINKPTTSGSKPYFPQTGEMVHGGMGLLGGAVLVAVLFFFWKKKKENKEDQNTQNHQ